MRTKITKEIIELCAKQAPKNSCYECACNEEECIECLYEISHKNNDVEEDKQ